MSYAGDLTPAQAWDRLASGATLVDVRTDAEWTHLGIPDTSGTGRQPLFIEWKLAGGLPNGEFLAQLQARVPAPAGTELIFLCRSGVRSIAAAEAATAAGYTAYNVLEGFEGEQDAYGDRTVNGWKNRRLPSRERSSNEQL
ncbi:rhodanese-like domain-containing protein [Paenarthrobacter sp. Z7-10]|uniref:rhodanese-like domain-containing protein n=1 Tax=Paenarthrobacter sp. Z7-10 TaxID=2787635 RepID=UPI0022A95B22|nr:rhodanese-like domain-containing protein [Paenarthrobacter sp. Z7-10]MCZ2401864.1 rhodanese-like domain-containing protein [Paenarthrobacter sp. Z7-10]